MSWPEAFALSMMYIATSIGISIGIWAFFKFIGGGFTKKK